MLKRNPWLALDPDVHTASSGPAAGPGATMARTGDRHIGLASLKSTVESSARAEGAR